MDAEDLRAFELIVHLGFFQLPISNSAGDLWPVGPLEENYKSPLETGLTPYEYDANTPTQNIHTAGRHTCMNILYTRTLFYMKKSICLYGVVEYEQNVL